MTNLPVFFTSVAARAARLFKILEQAAAFLLPFMAFMGAIAAWDFGRAVDENEEMGNL